MDKVVFNKVLIIDDNFEEALPIIQALAIKGVPTIFWNGKVETKPKHPLNGVRSVILDMRFSSVTDSRSIITHLFTLLNNAISNENGPYILFIWSKHDNEYLDEFTTELRKLPNIPQPYLIINIEKGNFIKIINKENEAYNQVVSALDSESTIPLKTEMLAILENMGINDCIETIEIEENIIEKLIYSLDEKLKEANSLSILLMWENLVNIAASNLINDIARLSELGENWDNNIKTLIQNLALANAGKSLTETPKEYIINAMSSLNHMFPDELWNQLVEKDIDEDKFSFINVPAIEKNIDGSTYSILKSKKSFIVKKDNSDYRSFKNLCDIEETDNSSICKELHDEYLSYLGTSNYKLLCERTTSSDIKKPGSIYEVEDNDILEELSGFIFKDKKDISIDNFSLIKLDISSSCDYAQNKLRKVRLLIGIMIESPYYSKINDTDDIYCTPEINVNGKIVKIAFNFHYITYESEDSILESNKLFSFRELLLTEIKHKLSTYISRVGIINL